MNEHLHQEESDGGLTMREYIEVKGTENAYDSARCVGRSMNTISKPHTSIR